MEVTSYGLHLLFFLLSCVSLIFQATNGNEEFLEKIYGREIKLSAYQVILVKYMYIYNFKKVIQTFCCQFSPLFNYKKQKNGNYTFEGFMYEYMQDAQAYFNVMYDK